MTPLYAASGWVGATTVTMGTSRSGSLRMLSGTTGDMPITPIWQAPSIVLARLNWRNNRLGFWSNAIVVGVGDIPFILFVLVPGYVPLWPGILGPALWIAALACTAIAQVPTSTQSTLEA